MSPQLLLVLSVALALASVTGLCTRVSFIYFPVFWLIAVSSLLIGQVVGEASGWRRFEVGQVELGAGLLVYALALAGLYSIALWYNRKES